MVAELKKLKCGKIYEDVDLKKITSYKLKGKAKCVIIPNDQKGLINLFDYIKKNNLKYKIIGGGSNLIFDGDYDGILIRLALKCARNSLTGLEFATGIPGTVGGAIVNNAGAYKSDMGYIVEEVLVITPELEIKKLYNRDLNFHYRTSFFKENKDYIILQATIVLKRGKKDAIMAVIEDRKKRRLMSQPLDFPSAGSVFRNPVNNFAGKLIEDIGYKGKNEGGAKVSEKHANFIINTGDATGKDIIKLIEEIKEKIKKEYDIDLILEQEIVR